MPTVSRQMISDHAPHLNDATGACRCGVALVYKSQRDVGRKRFCSRECKVDALRGRPAITKIFRQARQCATCGIDFIATAGSHRYCSKPCQAKVGSHRKRMRGHNDVREHLKRLLAYKARRHLSLDYMLELYATQKGRCALSGMPLTARVGEGRVHTNLSIDRIDSAAGYVEGNIWLVCRVVNVMKNALTVDEFRDFCARVTEAANA